MSKNKLLELFYKVRDLSAASDKKHSDSVSGCYMGALGILSVAMGIWTLEDFENYVHNGKVKQ